MPTTDHRPHEHATPQIFLLPSPRRAAHIRTPLRRHIAPHFNHSPRRPAQNIPDRFAAHRYFSISAQRHHVRCAIVLLMPLAARPRRLFCRRCPPTYAAAASSRRASFARSRFVIVIWYRSSADILLRASVHRRKRTPAGDLWQRAWQFVTMPIVAAADDHLPSPFVDHFNIAHSMPVFAMLRKSDTAVTPIGGAPADAAGGCRPST